MRRPKSGLAVVCAILFLTFLDNTIVSVVLAGVQSSLGVGISSLQWMVDGYMLAFSGLMLAGGTLGDLFGRKAVMLGGVATFCAGSIVATVAPGGGVLIAGRVVMGIGAAASEPGTLSMIRHLYESREGRARALGAWAGVSGAALAFGPIIGGAIIGATSWRGVFAFSVVLGLIALVWGAMVLPENSDRAGRKLDLTGIGLGVVSLVSATTGIIEGESAGYLTWWVDLLFALAVAAGAAFVHYEGRREDPVLKLRFFANPTFSAANAVAFATNFGVFSIFFFTTLYLEIIGGFSGYQIALAFVTMAGAMVAAAALTGRWVAARGPRQPSVAGCGLAGAGILVVNGVLGPHVGAGTLAWSLGIVGLGFGMTLVAMTSAVLTIVPPDRSGMAASTVNTFRELGGVFGVAVLGAIVNGQLTAHLAAKLKALGIPANFRALVIDAVTHGGASHISTAGPGAAAATGQGHLVQQVIDAAYTAFGNGLNLALLISGALLLGTAVVSAFAFRGREAQPPEPA